MSDKFAYDLVDRHALVLNLFASADRGESWHVVSNYLPSVHAVTFAP